MEKAIRYFHDYLEKNPDKDYVHYSVAASQALMADFDEAIKSLHKRLPERRQPDLRQKRPGFLFTSRTQGIFRASGIVPRHYTRISTVMSSTRNLPNVVSLGGGSGLSCLLKGLKYAVADAPPLGRNRVMPWIAKLTAVVTVTDDGGSSGRLRDELQVLPPGDIRNCLVALSTDESLLSRLFQYRFPGSGDLKGHSFGNLLLTALTGVTGDFLKAIRFSSQVLAIRGQIYPLHATGRPVRSRTA